MIQVIILGGGNVATHLAKTFLKTQGVSLVQMYNRTLKNIAEFNEKVPLTDSLKELKKADIYIISVSDDAIGLISKRINNKNALIVHTSGSTPMELLERHANFGVFYPLQSFSKGVDIPFSNIPICLEANTASNLELLHKLASKLSNAIYDIHSSQREKLHIAAVFVNNFVNHLYYIGEGLCEKNDIDSNILIPLIQETAQKLIKTTAFKAQTGPAKRHDKKIIQNHLSELNENQREIYKLLSDSIAETYGKKL